MAMTLVQDLAHNPASNGTFSIERPLPGVNHHNFTENWTNSFAVPVLVIPEVTIFKFAIEAPQPNLTFIRTRMTVAVGGPADTPDITGEFDSEFGGGFDITDQNKDANPETGRLVWHSPASTIRKTPVELNPGQSIHIAVRGASYTPAPWLANANNNVPTHYAEMGIAQTRIWATALGTET